MDRNDLERMRALIRSRHSLPEPPRPDRPAEAVAPSPVAPSPVASPSGVKTPALSANEDAPVAKPRARKTFGRASATASAPSSTPAVDRPAPAAAPAEAVAAAQAVAPAQAAADGVALWTPDAALHRLVELVIEMRALVEAPAPRSALPARGPIVVQAGSRAA